MENEHGVQTEKNNNAYVLANSDGKPHPADEVRSCGDSFAEIAD